MDYELIFWIVAGVASVIGFALLMARANRELYVERVREYR